MKTNNDHIFCVELLPAATFLVNLKDMTKMPLKNEE